MPHIIEPLHLPCGAILANRLAKGATSEGLASPEGVPTEAMARLYRIWSHGGAGLLLTGNVIIDGDHLERPGNVIIDRPPSDAMQAALKDWAAAGTEGGNHLWMQISHGGRQTQKNVNPHPKAPSAVPVHLPGGRFGVPVPLTGAEIRDLVGGFAIAAVAAKEAGFTGVQIHGAHGYLVSQFLSPLANRRTDEWGGSLENRARFLLEIVRKVRVAVGPEFPIAVKLNSADFQRGGFAFEDSLQVARWLEAAGIDLLEISGGSYEQPAMANMSGIEKIDDPRLAISHAGREAYFTEFARAMKAEVKTVPVMVTGGFRSHAAMERALSARALDVIGIARPLCVVPDGCKALLAGTADLPRIERQVHLLPSWLRWLTASTLVRTFSSYAIQSWYDAQLLEIGRHGVPNPALSVLSAVRQVERNRSRWLAARKEGLS